MTNLVLVCGSLRAGSTNSAALRAFEAIARRREDVSRVSTLPIGAMPFYNADVEMAGLPDVVREAKARIAAADAVVISTPAYNGAPPGVLKNALDWLSRPVGTSAFNGKVVSTLSASPGKLGARPAQEALRQILVRCGASLVEHELVAIANAVELSRPSGDFTDPAVLAAITGLVEATVAMVRMSLATSDETS